MKTARAKRNGALIAVILVSLSAGGVLGVLAQAYLCPNTFWRAMDVVCERQFYADDDSQQTIAADNKKTITVRTRKYDQATDLENFDPQNDSAYRYYQRPLDLDTTALIVIDAWAYDPNDACSARVAQNMKLKLAPLLQLAREHNMLVIHCPHGREIAPVVEPLPHELVVTSKTFPSYNLTGYTIKLDLYLRTHNITTLLYAGYALNHCVLFNPTGIMRMRGLAYDIILLRDCTIAVETPETLDGEWAKKATILLIELHYGETTTLEDLRTALEEDQQALLQDDFPGKLVLEIGCGAGIDSAEFARNRLSGSV